MWFTENRSDERRISKYSNWSRIQSMLFKKSNQQKLERSEYILLHPKFLSEDCYIAISSFNVLTVYRRVYIIEFCIVYRYQWKINCTVIAMYRNNKSEVNSSYELYIKLSLCFCTKFITTSQFWNRKTISMNLMGQSIDELIFYNGKMKCFSTL